MVPQLSLNMFVRLLLLIVLIVGGKILVNVQCDREKHNWCFASMLALLKYNNGYSWFVIWY